MPKMVSVPENRSLQHGFTFQNGWDQGAHGTKARPPLWLRADDSSLPRALVGRFQASIVGASQKRPGRGMKIYERIASATRQNLHVSLHSRSFWSIFCFLEFLIRNQIKFQAD